MTFLQGGNSPLKRSPVWPTLPGVVAVWLSSAYGRGTFICGEENSIQIRHAQLKYLSVGLKLKLTGPSDLILVTYPT